MIWIEYNGTNNTVATAVNFTNNLFKSTLFADGISKLNYFDMADITPKKLSDIIQHTELQLSLDLYWPVPLTNTAYGYDDVQDAPVIHMNRLALNRPFHSICNTIMHQAVHAINAVHKNFSFGHGDNNPVGKEHTAPYCIAGLAEKMAANKNIDCDDMLHEDTANIPLIEQNGMKHVQEQMIAEGLFCVYDHIAVLQA